MKNPLKFKPIYELHWSSIPYPCKPMLFKIPDIDQCIEVKVNNRTHGYLQYSAIVMQDIRQGKIHLLSGTIIKLTLPFAALDIAFNNCPDHNMIDDVTTKHDYYALLELSRETQKMMVIHKFRMVSKKIEDTGIDMFE